LQISHQISAKSVNICNSKFSKVTEKHKCPLYRHRRDWLSSVRPCEWQDFSTSKVCVQNVHSVQVFFDFKHRGRWVKHDGRPMTQCRPAGSRSRSRRFESCETGWLHSPPICTYNKD